MLNELRSSFHIRNLLISTRLKVIVCLISIVFFALIAMNTVFYFIYSDNIRQVIIKEVNEKVDQTCTYVDITMRSIVNTSNIILNNSLIQKQLKDDGSSMMNGSIDYLAVKEIITMLQGIVPTIDGISSIDVYIDGSNLLITTDYGLLTDLDESITIWYKQLISDNKKVNFSDNYHKGLTRVLGRKGQYLTILRPVYDFTSGKKAGILAININRNAIRNILMASGYSSSIVLNKSGEMIVNASADIFSANNNESFFSSPIIEKQIMKEENGAYFNWVDGSENMFVYRTSGYTGWKFVSFVPFNELVQKITKLRDYVLLFLIVNFIVIFIVIWFLSKKIFNPVKKLILFMKKVEEGNFNVHIDDDRKDEYGYMYKSFNKMVGQIRYLFEELFQEKLLKKDAEIKLLQSKINPHFIYNIFDNMNWLMELGRYSELQKLMVAVSNFYKKSLNFGKDYVTVAETLEQLKSYSDIQMIRFKNRFTCDFDFDSSILDQLIPNFSLQPLLENAICHGIEPKSGNSRIQISGIQSENRMVFTIEDDGVGIAEERLNSILECLKHDENKTGNFFALHNVHKRIKLYYGDEFGLVVSSKVKAGTKVIITIPIGRVRG